MKCPRALRGFISFHIPPRGILHNGGQPLFHAATGGISFMRKGNPKGAAAAFVSLPPHFRLPGGRIKASTFAADSASPCR
jgi:hypothetical protein